MKRARTAALLAITLAGTMLFSGTAQATTGVITGSKFEAAAEDGNLIVDSGTGFYDWNALQAANRASAMPTGFTLDTRSDLASGGTDDSFAGGLKEDSTTFAQVHGSIPNNKSDLQRFYLAQENKNVEGQDLFVHLGWVRANTLGTANMDFEFNQGDPGGSGTATTPPTRQKGDLLITFDFASGGKADKVQLGLNRWATSNADLATLGAGGVPTTCQASASAPCWTARIDLVNSGLASGEINKGATGVVDSTGYPVSPVQTDPSLTFGEASINLTALVNELTGTTTSCEAFGSAFLKSRSSDSFTSQMKDFITPMPVDVSNCHVATPGEVDVIKVDDDGGPVAATFVLADGSSSTTPGAVLTTTTAGVTTIDHKCSTLTSGTDAGTCSMLQVDPGNYWVLEGSIATDGSGNETFTEGVPSGYAADTVHSTHQYVTVLDVSTSDVESVTFTNPRLFKVIVLVCKQSDNTLYASSVTDGTTGTTSLAHDAGGTLTDSSLCALGGASYSGQHAGVTTKPSYGVDIPVATP
jgi:hypothetical protein